MIKASELRLFNYILRGGHVAEVRAIIGDDNLALIDKRCGIGTYRNDGDCKPIPLTIEWLKKLGFEDLFDPNYDCGIRLERFTFAVSLERRLLLIADPKATNQRAKGIGEIPIEHVHQLQNLVFAIAGEELTIKQPV